MHATSNELCALSLSAVARLIRERAVSPVEVTESVLKRIDLVDSHINAFITVTADLAMSVARDAEREIAAGRYRGPLHGVPISIKDLFDTRGIRTTAASRVLANVVPDRDATIVTKLRDAGAVPIGKTNLLEFAYGDVPPAFGPSRNPWNTDYGTAGSSSGSGAAVAAGLGYGSIGTDTGGSIRGPAAYCGIVGLKPTYGLVSRAGAIPLSWSLDHVGPVTRTVRDCALLLDAISGFDQDDPTSRLGHEGKVTSRFDDPVAPLTIGVVGPAEGDGVAGVVWEAVNAAEAAVREAGFATRPVALPHPDHAARALIAIISAEASSIHRDWLRDHAGDYSPGTRERLELGSMLPASIYLTAQRVRAVIVELFQELFRTVDLLLLPVMAKPSYLIEAPVPQPDTNGSPSMLAGVRFEGPFNLTGQPAISVPAGKTAEGLPIGVQLAGRPFSEPSLLQVAAIVESAMAANLPSREGNPLLV